MENIIREAFNKTTAEARKKHAALMNAKAQSMVSGQVSQQLAGVILSSKELGSMESASRLVGQEELKSPPPE